MNGIEIVSGIVDYINAWVWQPIPKVLQGLVCALAFALIFRKQIKAYPVVFYLYPAFIFLWDILACITFLVPDGVLYEALGGEESWFWMSGWWLDYLGLNTTFGIGLIIIVMFIGVLPKTTLVKNLYVIRKEMSIIGGAILFGHGVLQMDNIVYFNLYYAGDVVCFIEYVILGIAILVLVFIPWITSFGFIRNKMKGTTWKKLQTYTSVPLFIGMLAFGIIMYLARVITWYPGILVDAWDINAWNAAHEDPLSLSSVASFESYLLAVKTYIVLLVSYVVLRIKKVKGRNRPAVQTLEQTPENPQIT
jgi:DMSO/TMAO reductase YedYZ heme-binding membrane subunit